MDEAAVSRNYAQMNHTDLKFIRTVWPIPMVCPAKFGADN